MPDFICNVIGGSIRIPDGYNVETGVNPTKRRTVKDTQGRDITFFDPNGRLFSIEVRNKPEGPKPGPSALRKDKLCMLSCE